MGALGEVHFLVLHPLAEPHHICVGDAQREHEHGLSDKPASGEAGFEACVERAKNVLHLRIRFPPLVNEFHIASRVIVRERLLQELRFQIQKDVFHWFWERYRVLRASRNHNELSPTLWSCFPACLVIARQTEQAH